MKKIVYLLAILGLLFNSCNPMDDVYQEIDANNIEDDYVGDFKFALTEEDYTSMGLSNSYFASSDEAKTLLADYLTKKYPGYGVAYDVVGNVENQSTALITYSLGNPFVYENYTVTAEDYAAIEKEALVNNDDFNALLDYKFPSSKKGTVVNLTYKTEPTILDYTLTNDDYALVGNGRFNNFDIREGRSEEDIEVRRAKIGTILKNNFPQAQLGTKYKVTYKAYNGSETVTLEMLLELLENDIANVTNYTLTDEDYVLVGNGRYLNFDIRPGRDEETIEARRAKIETILLNNFPDTAENQIYNVTYKIYDGSAGTREMLVKFNGTGYDLFGSTEYKFYTFEYIEKTSEFVYINEWASPLIFSEEDYTAMGQRYPNFSNNDDAKHYTSIYLKQLYPFAKADDFVSVQYKLYVGGGQVENRNINLIYDGTNWNEESDSTSETLQFVHDGSTWVPDNTIKYTLTNADYELVGNGRYNNFDIRSGRDEETIEARLAKINTILLNNFPNDADGQKYIVTYAYYDGANGNANMKVIKSGSAYILNE